MYDPICKLQLLRRFNNNFIFLVIECFKLFPILVFISSSSIIIFTCTYLFSFFNSFYSFHALFPVVDLFFGEGFVYIYGNIHSYLT